MVFNCKEYYATHPKALEKRKEYMRNYNKKPEIKKRMQEIQRRFREKNKLRDVQIRAEKYKNDVKYKLSITLRARIGKAIKYNLKAKHTLELIGCSVKELKEYLEKQFKPGMSWVNHSQFGWHIDHKIPCDAFDLSKEEEQCKCFHYTNLQPLWWNENLSKNRSVEV